MRIAILAAAQCLTITLVFGQAAAAEKHQFTFDDWAALRSARAIAVSPDGNTILYNVRFGGAKGRTNDEWRTIPVNGPDSKKLDLPVGFTPFGFTADGTSVYGTYRINNIGQFAVFGLEGLTGKSVPQITVLLPRGIHGVVPSPDGSHYALLADPRPPDDLAETRNVIEPDQTSIYVVKSNGTGGEWWCSDLKWISGGPDPASGNPSIAWSPQSSQLAVVSMTPKIGFHYVRSYIDTCSASGRHRLAEISNTVSGIAWTKDNNLAFLSTANSVLTPDELYMVPESGGKSTDRTPGLDGTAVSLALDPHGHLWVQVNRGVRSEITEFRDGSLISRYQWTGGCVLGPPVFSPYSSSSAQLAFTVGDPTRAPNVAILQSGELHKITTEGDDLIAKVALGTVRNVHWTNKESIPLEGIVTFPSDHVDGKKSPFLVLPHGGPEANDLMVLDALSRIIAGLGYVVLQPEYRGSTGYGDKFLDSIYQHFGDRAYSDVDSATDYAISQGWADPNRLAMFGWSAGGFMTSWTVTQTNRYRAAIEGAGITDWASFIWTSDVQQIDFDARWPSEDAQPFRKFSAVDFVDKVTTPILVLHGGADNRVPTYQGREFFESLEAHGKTTRMVEYPGSPHFPVLWEQRQNIFREIEDWLKHYNP
ncbi:MAG TPA: prolyl oligopeptidase family serine peptidase [Bryobacteraceae bacterium]|nr:prolyl oligopeptidase family serine peptidase [Bryobacteraceae bacterium]